MATQPLGPHSPAEPSHWYTSSATCNRSYQLALLRGGIIAMLLLVVLAVIVLF